MMPSKVGRHAGLALLLVIGLTACNSDDTVDLSTTSSVISGQPPTDQATTTSIEPTGSSTTATTVLVGEPVEEYQVVGRASDTSGETIYVVVPPAAYTDVDIENFVLDLFEDGTATFGAEVFDDEAAVDAYRKPEAERTEEETALIDQHHLASLQNGTTIVFRGPLSGSGEIVIGS
jgi:hypothetical protein